MKTKLVHIYYNTSGNSGLYLNPIEEALKKHFIQIFLVNYYYPLSLDEYKKIFFKYTEKNEYNVHRWILRTGIVRKIIRLFELKIANIKIVKYLKEQKPDIVNYSLTNMPDALTLFRKIRKYLPNCRIVVTCHDVVPFQATSRIKYQEIYDYADFLIVHTQNAINILKELYKVSANKILYHPFPIIDLSLLRKHETKKHKKEQPNFLFIGVIRQEKGVQNLIDAWERLGPSFPAQLHIAGFKPDDVQIDTNKINNFPNVKLTIRSLSDMEYFDAVDESDYVIFPYSQVGNSGVLSTVVSLGKVPITTRLPTFMESQYCLEDLSCEPDNVEMLSELLEKICYSFSKEYKKQVNYIEKKLDNDRNTFKKITIEVYKRIMQNEEKYE